jgi:predicted glycogen debranching enzyme
MKEWIVTNGLGGYASLTHQNTNTRKFHGLLIASLNPPTKRWVFVSNVFDQIQFGESKYDLRNFKNKFSFDVFPSFSYELDDIKIKKTIFMEYEKNTTVIRYKIDSDKQFSILHNPLINSRHFYDVNSQRYLSFHHEIIKNGVKIKPENIDKTLKIFIKDANFKPLNYWEELFYNKDRERNESWVDNNVHIGRFEKNIEKSCEYYLVLTIEDNIKINPTKIYTKEINRKKDLLINADLPVKCNKLILSTDNFIVQKDNSKSVIAGYHWFGDWGRDTLIALPGLTLVTKRYKDASEILLNLSKYCSNGLIPNAFMDRDKNAVYNSVDASLWFIDRVFQYLKYTNDKKTLEKVWKTLQLIIYKYIKGTDFGIKMDDDFLINHDPGLTWMDIKINDYYSTPRSKKAVEIQALWYNALRIMSNFAQLLKKNDKYIELYDKLKESFNYKFNDLYDVIDAKDASFRPNLIFLASLDFTMIDKNLQKKIVDDVEKNLFTIFGLRSLSPYDPNYKSKYIGDYNKDIAYHNGIVWPWLMGPFIKAYVKVNNYNKNSREYAFNKFLKPMLEVFGNKWDGSINEIFDGEPIYAPRGCITQAWSVAEILRAWVEDIEFIKPKYENIFKLSEIRV